jgi:acetolactate decarboxylase
MKTIWSVTWLFLVCLASGGCATSATTVKQYGTFRDVMRGGHREARLSLEDAAGMKDAVAIGAVEGLQGEITILDGNVWVARRDGDRLRVTGPELVSSDKATFLTLARVGRWQNVALNANGGGADRALEGQIEATARQHGIDTTKPFPFVIEGTATEIEMHVINGSCPFGGEPATMDTEPWRRKSQLPVRATIVGVFAADSAGVMTHHETSIHAHALLELDGRMATCHVDRVSMGPRATLRIPVAN